MESIYTKRLGNRCADDSVHFPLKYQLSSLKLEKLFLSELLEPLKFLVLKFATNFK